MSKKTKTNRQSTINRYAYIWRIYDEIKSLYNLDDWAAMSKSHRAEKVAHICGNHPKTIQNILNKPRPKIDD